MSQHPMQCWLHDPKWPEISASALHRYITNTKVKLVLVIAINATNFKDDDLIAVRPLIGSLNAGRVGCAGLAQNHAVRVPCAEEALRSTQRGAAWSPIC